jgi:ABC-type multidrug transport system fused ATPase/permease subunit
MQADRILLFNENGISDIGSPESLLKSGDYYRSLIADQKTEHSANDKRTAIR